MLAPRRDVAHRMVNGVDLLDKIIPLLDERREHGVEVTIIAARDMP
jgi:hypothetical protein